MRLQYIRLHRFRCYSDLDLRPHPRFNVFVGLNGQGKTTILEAIGLLATLRSFRNAKNTEMLLFDHTEGLVAGSIKAGDLDFGLEVKLWPHRKQATLNKKHCRFLSEYTGKLSSVSFSPADLEILRGEPENRRLWLDRLAQIYFPEHIDVHVRFKKVLDQRNSLLRSLSEQNYPQSEPSKDFETWTQEFVKLGAQVIHNRIHSVDKSVDKIALYYREISGHETPIKINYLSAISEQLPSGLLPPISIEIIEQALASKLAVLRHKEWVVGSTLAGPHRDDLEFRISDHSIKSFGSQGELRSMILAMRLAEVKSIKEMQKVSPMLLIDDFSSELDANRRKYLLDYLIESDSQVFLTTTEKFENEKFLGDVFVVDQGKVFSPDAQFREHLTGQN